MDYSYGHLAFDTQGNLWVTVLGESTGFSQIREFTPAQLQNLRQDPTPAPVLSLFVTGDGDGGAPDLGALAFDAEGDLWIGAQDIPSTFNLYRFPAARLAAGGAPDLALKNAPSVAWYSLAISPIPPGLPIQP